MRASPPRSIWIIAAGMGSLLVLAAGEAPTGASPEIKEGAEVAAQPDRKSAQQKLAAASQGVLGSKHDFSMVTGRAGDACSACHVPHIQAVRPQLQQDESFALSFYRIGGQREILVADRYLPGPSSLICLSCHNGTVASSTIGSAHALLAGRREGFALPDHFTMRDHPVGVEYPLHATDYRSRAEVTADGRIALPDGRIECVSCHDPHNAAGIDKMLVMTNVRSALCLACHRK